MKLRKLETNTPGLLYLHSMPGRYEPIAEFLMAIGSHDITQIVCLASEDEIAQKSPDYAKAITEEQIPVQRVCSPIPDFGTPQDIASFYALVRETADKLRAGTNVLVHCAGGIGRTGTFAGCILKCLGLPLIPLEESGSFPETEDQLQLAEGYAHKCDA